MSDILWASIIALSGALITSVIAAIVHIKTTKRVSDNARQTAMLKAKTTSRLDEKRQRKEHIADLIADLVSIVDPEINIDFDYRKITVLVNRIQLRLIRNNEKERNINGCLNNICFAVNEVATGSGSSRGDILNEQGKLIDTVWDWFNS
jgi:hypothetical protein